LKPLNIFIHKAHRCIQAFGASRKLVSLVLENNCYPY
jgi:hypothetical protein